MQCIVMGRPLRALTKGFRGTTASQTPDPGPHGVVDCAAHSDICVQTRGIDALTPVESLYSERLPMHTFVTFAFFEEGRAARGQQGNV